VVVLPSLLSTGLVMLFGSILIIRELLKSIPLKLDLYRRLRSVGDLSLGVAFWTFLAMVNIVGAGIFSGFYLPLVGLTVLASAGLFAILFFPVMSARNAIIRAKRRKLTTYERRLHTLFSVVDYRISAKAERNEKTLAAHMAAVGEDYPDLKELLTVDAPLDKLFAAREETQQFIKEIEDIPALPITWVGLLQIVITSSSPTAGLLIAQWLTGKQQ